MQTFAVAVDDGVGIVKLEVLVVGLELMAPTDEVDSATVSPSLMRISYKACLASVSGICAGKASYA